jgi:hypothetical protein
MDVAIRQGRCLDCMTTAIPLAGGPFVVAGRLLAGLGSGRRHVADPGIPRRRWWSVVRRHARR